MPDLDQINIAVTDIIPPDNFATVDAGAKVGTVYTKEQDNAWRKEVEATTQSGIKGVAKPDTPYDPVTNPIPTPWTVGSPNLYEKYDVNEAGVFPNFIKTNDQPVEVTSQELQLNEVQIWVKNGVAEKHLKAMPQASVNIRKWEDLQSSDFPLNAGFQVIYQEGHWIVSGGQIASSTDIPIGGSLIWKLIGSIEQTINSAYGIYNKSFYYSSGDLVGVYYIGNNIKLPKDEKITKIGFDINGSGNVNIAIGKVENNIFIERSDLVLNSSTGVNNHIVDLDGLKDEILVFKSPLIPMGVLQGQGSGIYSTNGGDLQSAAGLVTLFFETTETINKIDEHLFEPSNVSSYGSTQKTYYYSGLTGVEYLGLNKKFDVDKYILDLEIDVQTSGTLKMSMGLIDQWNKFIERKTLEFQVVAGVNNISVNEKLLAGEYFLTKTPFRNQGVNTSPSSGQPTEIYFNENGGVAQTTPNASAYKVTYGDLPLIDPNLNHEISNLNSRIAELSVKKDAVITSNSGKKYKIAINDTNGSAELILKELNFTRILVLGNSLAKHPITTFWWGERGMASSEISKDMAHQLLELVQVHFPTAQVWSQNISEWETDMVNYNKADIDLSMNPNLIVLKPVENVTSNNFGILEAEYFDLITYLENNAPNATIISGGSFWPSVEKDSAIYNAATAKGIPFASISDLYTAENRSFIGAVVKGDDGLDHIVDNAGVADHPGDLGFKRIAQRLFNTLGL